MNLLDYAAYAVVYLLALAWAAQVCRELWNFKEWDTEGADQFLPIATVLTAVVVIALACARVAQLQ